MEEKRKEPGGLRRRPLHVLPARPSSPAKPPVRAARASVVQRVAMETAARAVSPVARRRGGGSGKSGGGPGEPPRPGAASPASPRPVLSSGIKMALKNVKDLRVNFIRTLKKTNYSQWQRDNTTKKPAEFKVFLPPVESVSAKKKEDEKHSRSKSKDNLSGKKPTAASRSKMYFRKGKKTQQAAFVGEHKLTKGMKKIKILEQLCKAKKNTVEEMKRHSNFLFERNQKLVEGIKEKDAETAQSARHLLQQYDMFGVIIASLQDSLQDSSQNPVGLAKADLKATEKMMKKNLGKLEQELSRMNSKVLTLQEELNFLRTYMDKEYPVQSVQISSLLRNIRQLSEEQQDELEETKEMSKMILKKLAEKTLAETESLLESVVEEKASEYHGGIQQMCSNNRELRRQIHQQKKIIDNLKKEIETLQKSLVILHQDIRHPREVIFENVLLQRPICTPDMEVVLNIPKEEDLRL